MSAERERITLEVDAELFNAAEKCALDCGFADVNELVEFLMRRALRVEDRAHDAEELALIEERLRDLGYLE